MGYFFEQYLAAVLILFLFILWKAVTLFRGPMFISARDMDVTTGMRQLDPLDAPLPSKNPFMRVVHALF